MEPTKKAPPDKKKKGQNAAAAPALASEPLTDGTSSGAAAGKAHAPRDKPRDKSHNGKVDGAPRPGRDPERPRPAASASSPAASVETPALTGDALLLSAFAAALAASTAPRPFGQGHTVQLIDAQRRFRVADFDKVVRDQCDFSVIGALGLQGTGKSSLLSQFSLDQIKKKRMVCLACNYVIATKCTYY